MTRRNLVLAGVCALVVVLGGWALLHDRAPGPAQATARGVGASTCPIATLPREVTETVRRIHAGGPFPFPRSDGEVFANYEGHLPKQRRGYYHEYTVVTPRARDRSMRRVVTGGTPLAHPAQYFYTGDHYDSFCVITDAGGQR